MSPETQAAIRRQVVSDNPSLRHDFSALRRLAIAEALAIAGIASTRIPALTDRAFNVFFDARNEVEPYEDVLPALARLAARFRLVAVTNGNADITRMALGRYFEAAIHARDVRAAKPDKPIFDAAAQRLGLPGAAIVHVGDHLEHDVAGSRSAGLHSIWLDRSEHKTPDQPATLAVEVPRVRCLSELADLLGCA